VHVSHCAFCNGPCTDAVQTQARKQCAVAATFAVLPLEWGLQADGYGKEDTGAVLPAAIEMPCRCMARRTCDLRADGTGKTMGCILRA
jgi:hypothetical protein